MTSLSGLKRYIKNNPEKINKKYHSVIYKKSVEAGEGYMKNGQYIPYTDAEKTHVQGANANKNAAYTDTATNSALGTYQEAQETEQEPVNPALGQQTAQDTVLGKVKKKKLGEGSVLGGASILGK